MKAIQITAPGQISVVAHEKPVIADDEVLVKIHYCGFCGSDLNTFLGKNPMVKLPVIPGHEIGATINQWNFCPRRCSEILGNLAV